MLTEAVFVCVKCNLPSVDEKDEQDKLPALCVSCLADRNIQALNAQLPTRAKLRLANDRERRNAAELRDYHIRVDDERARAWAEVLNARRNRGKK